MSVTSMVIVKMTHSDRCESLNQIVPIHSTCASTSVTMYVRIARRCAGSERAARTHCTSIARRMMPYPMTMTVLSKWPFSTAWNKSGMPSVKMTTPIICTVVSSPYSQSSVS